MAYRTAAPDLEAIENAREYELFASRIQPRLGVRLTIATAIALVALGLFPLWSALQPRYGRPCTEHRIGDRCDDRLSHEDDEPRCSDGVCTARTWRWRYR